MVIITVKVAGDDQTLSQKYQWHNDTDSAITLSHEDPTLSKMVTDTIEKFEGAVDDVYINFKYAW